MAQRGKEVYDLSDKNFFYRIFAADFPPYDDLSRKKRRLYDIGLGLFVISSLVLIGFILGQGISRYNSPPVIVSSFSRPVPFPIPGLSICVLNNTSRGSPGRWLKINDTVLSMGGESAGNYLLNISEVRTCNYSSSGAGGIEFRRAFNEERSETVGNFNCVFAFEEDIYVPPGGGQECLLFNNNGELEFDNENAGIYLSIGLAYSQHRLSDTFPGAPRNVLPPIIHLGFYNITEGPESTRHSYGAPGQLNNLVFSTSTFTTLNGQTNYSYPATVTSVPYVPFDIFNQNGCIGGICISVIYIYLEAETFTITSLEEERAETIPKIISNLGGALSICSFFVFFVFGVILTRIIFKDRRAYIPHPVRESVLWLSKGTQGN